MNLQLVRPDDLRQHWPRILASLCAVRAKASEDWIAEDVYHAIKSGEAACHVGLVDGAYAGVLITRLAHAEFSGTPALHIWIVHSLDGDALDACLPMLRDMAKRAGVSRITFGSPRPGWAKRFPLVSATYEVPL